MMEALAIISVVAVAGLSVALVWLRYEFIRRLAIAEVNIRAAAEACNKVIMFNQSPIAEKLGELEKKVLSLQLSRR